MERIVSTGRTVQEAIDNGLKELNVDRDRVETSVLEVPQKGFLGILGSKLAKVEITVKEDVEQIAKDFLGKILGQMHIEADIETKLEDDVLHIEIQGKNMGIIIGRRGETLDALQYLTSLTINKGKDQYTRVVLDTENYRSKREKTLQQLAERLARKVERTNKKVMLEPMNPYERRIIHSHLQDHPKVSTYSEGEDPYRKVVISLKSHKN